MSDELDQISPEEIKEWLKSIGETREWLAKACHVSKPTVDGWLSAGRSIPRPAMSILKGLMGKRIEINPRIELAMFLTIQSLATQDGVTFNEWIENILKKAVKAREDAGFPVFESLTHKPEFPHLAGGAYAVKRFNTRKPTPAEVDEEWAANGRVGLLESINPAFPPIAIKSEIEWLAWLDPKDQTP